MQDSEQQAEIRAVSSADLAALAGEVLEKGKPVKLEVQGESMRPTLLPGDRITLAPVRYADLRYGCLIAYRAEEKLVVHRFLGTLQGGWLRTAGDAVDHRDAPVNPDLLLGRVVGVEREGRTFLPRSGRLEALRWEARRVPAWLRRRLHPAG